MSEVKYIAHYGIKDMKWYHRRFQNPDGSLTPLGRARYGVGEARKKAGEAIKAAPKKAGAAVKAAPKKISRAVKKTASDLKRDYREAQVASKQRRIQRRKERAERLALKLAERESKTTLRDIKAHYDESKIEAAKKRVDALVAKQDRIKELAMLKEQEKQLKSSMKDVKRQAAKDAHKTLSKSDIRYLSDEQLAERIERLKQEKTLAGLEFERATPTWVSKVGEAALGAATDTVKNVARDALTKAGKKWLGLDELEPDTPKTRAQKLKDTLDEMRAKKDLDDFISNLGNAAADEQLAREAKRLQTLANIETSKRTINAPQDSAEDTALAREAKRLQTLANIETSKRTIEGRNSEEDRSKERGQKITERREMERRAKAFRDQKDSDGSYKFTIPEIAKRLGISEDEVRDYLYEK